MFYDNYEKLCVQKGEKPFTLPLKLGAKSNSMVAQWKKGSTPRPEMLHKIADYLEVSTSELLYGDSNQKEKAPTVSDEASPFDYQILDVIKQLSPELKAQALDFARFLVDNSKK